MIIKAKLNYLPISPRKVRLVTQLIKGLDAQDAENQLLNIKKRASLPVLKLLKSAVANAHNNFNINPDSKLRIANIIVNQGPSLKRWRPRAFGRAYSIHKKTSHVLIELEAKEVKKLPKKTGKVPAPQKEKIAEKQTTVKPSQDKKKFFFNKETEHFNRKQAKSVKRRFFQRKAF